MEGPHLSTRAESRLYRQWGSDVIGMTAMPEARLAREAEPPYALIGMVTDYDCWRSDGDDVDITQILAQLQANAATAQRLIVELAKALPGERPPRSEEHTSELQSLMRISYAVFCLKQKNKKQKT